MNLSIATPTLNSASTLAATLDSIQGMIQSGTEHLLVDSGSSDGTVQSAESRGSRILFSPKGNMYSAINDGLRKASGEWMTYINGDDLLYSDAVTAALDGVAENVDVIYGNIDYIDQCGRFLFSWRSPSPARLPFLMKSYSAVPQQGTLFRRRVFEALGGFDTRFRYSADYDFWVRALSAGFRFQKFTERTLAGFRLLPTQLSQSRRAEMAPEGEAIRARAREGLSTAGRLVPPLVAGLPDAQERRQLLAASPPRPGLGSEMSFEGMMIVFSGTDGAGKSTQIGLLEAALQAKGVSTRRIWARGGYTPLFSVLKSAIRFVRPTALPRPGGSAERSKRFGSSRVRRTWIVFAILDLMMYYSIWLRLCRMLGGTVICDRYFDDTLLDFQRNFPQESVERWSLWRFLVWSAPRPSHRFLLLVPPEESARRGKLKNEPFPDSPETLAWRYDRYLQLASAGGWEVLDCRRAIDEVQTRIREVLGPCA